MKITIELADDLVIRANRYAVRHGITLRAVIEDGIRLKLRSETPQTAFKLRNASVGGNGLQPELRDQGWHKLRQAAYVDRGG